MLNLNSIMIGSTDPDKLSEFYGKVFEAEPDWQDGQWSSYQVGVSSLMIGPHSEVSGKITNQDESCYTLKLMNQKKNLIE